MAKLILNGAIESLTKGYPTRVAPSDTTVPATLSKDSADGHFGDLVTFADGYFKVIDSTTTITKAEEIAGVLLATNVKLVTDFLGDSDPITKGGEAFNLCTIGYVALELDSSVTIDTVKAGAFAYVTAEGKITTSSSAIATTNFVFTGQTFTEDDGTNLVEVKLLYTGA